jgi:hypothetical protein
VCFLVSPVPSHLRPAPRPHHHSREQGSKRDHTCQWCVLEGAACGLGCCVASSEVGAMPELCVPPRIVASAASIQTIIS